MSNQLPIQNDPPLQTLVAQLRDLIRESFGLLLVAAFFFSLPPLFAKKWLKSYYEKMGPARFHIMVFLGLTMLSLPIKMMLRWTLNMHYIVAIPEIYFNI